MNNLLLAAIGVIPLLLSLTVHEYAHAWTAHRLGDDTAMRMGRLTLNPIPHIDPLGTVILPVLLAATGSPVMFGWAKPVPIDPSRFRRGVSMGKGMAISAGAGPGSNLLLAVLSTVILALMIRLAPGVLLASPAAYMLLQQLIVMNVVLALFNLIPVPPLDGSRIAEAMVPYRLRSTWESFASLSPFLLLAIMFFGGRLISGPASAVLRLLDRLANAIAGAI